MKREVIEVYDHIFPTIVIQASKVDDTIKDESIEYMIADTSLWDFIGNDCMSGDAYANSIDEQIYFYTHFPVEEFKNEKELIAYMEKYCV